MNESLPDAKEEPAAVVSKNGHVKVKLKSSKVLTTDAVLYALGRDGNTRDLGLNELGIPTNQYGLLMKKGSDPKRESPDGFDPITYQTKVPSIYVAGDVIGAPALASTSMEQGRLAKCHPLACATRPSSPRFFRWASSRSRRFRRLVKPKKNAKTQIFRTSSARTKPRCA